MPEIIGTSKNIWNFDPRSIPGCCMWFDAADSSTFTPQNPSNTQTITQWRDKSSNSNHLVQSTASTVTSSGTYSTTGYNGRPAVFMNPTGVSTYGIYSTQSMWSSNTVNFQSFFPSNDTNTFFMVFSQTGGVVGAMSLQWTQNSSGNSHVVQDFGSGNLCVSGPGINSNIPKGMGSNLLITWVTRGLSSTSESYDTYIYGSPTSPITYLNTADSGYTWNFTERFVIGAKDSNAAYYGIGYHAEYIMYNQALTTAQRQQVEGYLAWKWNLQTAPTSIPLLPTSVSGCTVWLDGVDPSGNGTKLGNGSNVSTWTDKSGNAYSPTASAGAFPTYSSVSNCVVWNGSANTQLVFPVGISNAVVSRAFTIFIVEERTTGAENFIVRGSNQAANSNLLIGWGSGTPTTTRRFAFYANDLDYNNLQPYTAGEGPTLGCWQYSKPNRAIFYNGQINAGATDTNSSDLLSWSGAMIGGAFLWPAYNGKVFEMIFYNRAISTAERLGISSYLMTKWAIETTTSIFPSSNPSRYLGSFARIFSPIDLESDIALWLDAADASTIQLSGTSNIVSWKDKSPNAYLMSNTTTASQPTYVTSGLNGSYPCVRVNGSVTGGNQFLTTPLFTGFTGTTWDVYFVVKTTGTQNALLWFDNSDRILILASGSGGNGAAYSIHWGSGGSGSWRLGPNIGAATTQNTYLYQLYSTGSLLGRRINGVVPGDTRTQTASQSYGVVSSAKPLFLCNPGGAWSTGDSFIGEMLIFSNVLSANQRQRLEGYLSDKWGLVVSHIPTGFSPTSISGCQLWFDASDRSSITPSSITTGTKVSQWNDKSGNARHMSNATSATQPTYSTSNVAGSLPSVYFIGGNDAGANAGILSNSASTVFNSTTWDVYAVFKPTSVSAETAIFWNDPTVAVVLICGTANVSPVYSVHYGGWRLAPTDGPCRANEVQLYQSYSTGTTLGRRVNGGFDGTVAQTASYSWPSRSSNSELAFTRPSTGQWTSGNTSLCEIIVYNAVLSDANRSNVQSYLTNKWYVGTGVQLGNPFYSFPPSSSLPWSPTNITGCFLWLDAADPLMLITSNTSNIGTWLDKSGNGYHAISLATPATIVNSSFGGNTSLLFNGASRYICSTAAISNSGYTIFTVQNTTSVSGGGSASGYQRAINANNYAFVGVSNGYVATFTGSGSGWNDVASNSPYFYNVNTNVIVCMQVSNAVLTPYINGVIGTTKTGTTGAFSNFYIGNESGGTQPWYGNISEIIVYNGLLSTNQRQQVEGYLAWKWGLNSSAAPSDSMKLLFWADQCTATAQTLSAIATYASLFINRLALPVGLGDYSGTTLTIPYTGAYMIEISGWRCGAGTGQTRAIATRNGTTVYQRTRGVAQADCGIWIAQFYWNLFRAGDVLTLYKSDNFGGTPIGTTTNQNSASDDARGPVKIWFIQ